MDRAYTPVDSLLEQAARIVRREKETAGTAEPPEGYKRGQTERLIAFASDNHLWVSPAEMHLEFLSKGGENEVYTGNEDDIVVKLNNFEYAGDDLENFFIRIAAHNRFFANVPYRMTGFAYNSRQEFCAVLTQPYIKAEREATEDEIAAHMQALGFKMDYYDEFHNGEYKVFDAAPNNVLYGIDGNLYFIDTQIRKLQRIHY
ncbi:MAG TPA: hypothetical protein H9814_00190 [Candidatus Bacteroides merdigallinarum]|uniref:Uncharacterized protein n=1 Tax=Candidatus Bacteroides merdigallinarum TaxID=2838473 RepID=A0A9D2J0Q6_9BACE|nr:hypothetical protein [Candidatus Bacteroides merdigallinarum]